MSVSEKVCEWGGGGGLKIYLNSLYMALHLRARGRRGNQSLYQFLYKPSKSARIYMCSSNCSTGAFSDSHHKCQIIS